MDSCGFHNPHAYKKKAFCKGRSLLSEHEKPLHYSPAWMKSTSILNAVNNHNRALALESEADLKAGVRRLDVCLVTFKLETYVLFFPGLCWHKT